MKNIARKPLYLLSVLLLSACGGGGGSGTEPVNPPSLKASAKVVTDSTKAYMSDKEAILGLLVEVTPSNQLSLQAVSNNSKVQILSKELVATTPADTGVKFRQKDTPSSCKVNMLLSSGEHCTDQWEVVTTKERDAYEGKLIYTTSVGVIESIVKLSFKPSNDPEFQKSKFSITQISPIAIGEVINITLNNATANAINNPNLIFPEVIKPYISKISEDIFEIKGAESVVLQYKLEDSAQAQQALKLWQKSLHKNESQAQITYDSARSTTQAYPLTPTIYLSNVVANTDTISQFKEIDGQFKATVSLLNTSTDAITDIHAKLAPFADAIEVDMSKCSLPLAKNNSCVAEISIDPSIAKDLQGLQNFEIEFSTPNDSNRESYKVNFAVDTSVNVSASDQNTLIANYDNQIAFKNNGFMHWYPSKNLGDYKIYDAQGNDLTSEFAIEEGLVGANCLTGNAVAQNANCYITIKPLSDLSDKLLSLQIENSNNQFSLLLPSYSKSGASANALLNPSAVVQGKALSLYFTVGLPESVTKTFNKAELLGASAFTVDESYPNSCTAGKPVSSNQICQLKVDIPADAVTAEFKPQLVIHWQDETQMEVPVQVEVIDPDSPDADTSALFNFHELKKALNYIDINEKGLVIKLNNPTNKVISGMRVEILPQWLREIIDMSNLSKITTLSANQEANVELALQVGKTADDLASALKANMTSVISNANSDETGGQVIRFTSNNALAEYRPLMQLDTFPYIASLAIESAQKLSDTMIFGKPGQQYIELINPTDYRYTIAFSEALPHAITRVTAGGANGLANCSEFPILQTKERCALILEAKADANVNTGDHLDIIMTPQEGSISQSTTLAVDFQVNYVYSIAYEPEAVALELPISGKKHYDLKLVNNEESIQWLPSTSMIDYVVTHDDGVTGLMINAPAKVPSCFDGAAVASGSYCYIGLEVSDHTPIKSDYQLSLKMGQSNLAVDTLDVGEVSIVDHGVASVQLQQYGHSVKQVISGESVDIVITPPQDWHGSSTTDQVYSISSNNSHISFPNGNQCVLSVSQESPQCSVIAEISEDISSGEYLFDVTSESTTSLPLNQYILNLAVSSVKYSALSAGYRHTCALDLDNQAYCWGYNASGELGNGTYKNSMYPTKISQGELPKDYALMSISLGNVHTCALDSENQAYCWGENGNGQLGNGNNTSSHSPVKVLTGDIPQGVVLTSIALGNNFSCAIASNQKAYCWGGGFRNTPMELPQGQLPQSAAITSIGLGQDFGCLLDHTGQAYCWGINDYYKLGNKVSGGSTSPVAVNQQGLVFKSIHTGNDHACGVTEDNKAYCWGHNKYGQLGNNMVNEYGEYKPSLVAQGALPDGVTIKAMSLGFTHSCILGSDQKAYCWGGHAGVGSGFATWEQTTPIAVKSGSIPNNVSLVSIATGAAYSCALGNDYKSYCWGGNHAGQLGDGTFNLSYVPVKSSLPLI
ncbi:RCC1 domain-containing protein [Cysteiniphilum halobium]|uniref:RCC1 domain-containing protein n=1 Tax=Cysteiniphilum halobium TaxID=2219059 RepID=UPI000E65087E|nr:hypothetical protein [Cysteiniphilum halobium]